MDSPDAAGQSGLHLIVVRTARAGEPAPGRHLPQWRRPAGGGGSVSARRRARHSDPRSAQRAWRAGNAGPARPLRRRLQSFRHDHAGIRGREAQRRGRRKARSCRQDGRDHRCASILRNDPGRAAGGSRAVLRVPACAGGVLPTTTVSRKSDGTIIGGRKYYRCSFPSGRTINGSGIRHRLSPRKQGRRMAR